jgi:hypothetical protein
MGCSGPLYIPDYHTRIFRVGRPGDGNPVEATCSAFVQTGHETHPSSYAMGCGYFPGVKRPGSGVNHQSPCNAEVKERVELYLCCPSGPTWPVLGRTLPFIITFEVVRFSPERGILVVQE